MWYLIRSPVRRCCNRVGDDHRVLAGGTYAGASRMAAQYSSGDTTIAYVDPSNPAQAVLVHEPAIPTIPVIALIAVPGIAALLAALRLRTLDRANSQV